MSSSSGRKRSGVISSERFLARTNLWTNGLLMANIVREFALRADVKRGSVTALILSSDRAWKMPDLYPEKG